MPADEPPPVVPGPSPPEEVLPGAGSTAVVRRSAGIPAAQVPGTSTTGVDVTVREVLAALSRRAG